MAAATPGRPLPRGSFRPGSDHGGTVGDERHAHRREPWGAPVEGDRPHTATATWQDITPDEDRIGWHQTLFPQDTAGDMRQCRSQMWFIVNPEGRQLPPDRQLDPMAQARDVGCT